MIPVATSKKLARYVRWGLIGVVVLMGAALVATVWSTNRAVGAASDTLVRGQAEVFRAAATSRARRPGGKLTQEQLDDLLEEHAEDGLRYVATFNRAGTRVVQAGSAVGGSVDLTSRELESVSGRVRVVFGPRARKARRNNRRSTPARRAKRLQRSQRATTIVIEFEPKVSDTLSAAATTSLGIGGIAGLALIAFALVLVRWYQRAEARELAAAHERRLASLGQMSAVLAHEIRNPIASLKGNAQLLVKMLADDGKPRSKAERLVLESTRIETLTNELLDFARIGTIERAPSSPAAILREAAASVDGERIRVDDREAPALWSVDHGRLRQVLTNLLENACQASAESVDVWVGTEGRELCFTVRDRGDGIPVEDLEHLFEPFYTRKTRGTGLGLAVAQRMVELHGGMIAAGNHAEGGAIFTVTIPPA